MRYTSLILIVATLLFACNKNNGNTAPQIKFKSITPFFEASLNTQQIPLLTIQLKDEDGDIGFKENKDTAYLYVKNITVPPFKMDSFKFPTTLSQVSNASFKNFIDVTLDLNGNILILGSAILYPSSTPTNQRPRRDSTFFEVYVKDFKKNKSNVIKTEKPIVLITP